MDFPDIDIIAVHMGYGGWRDWAAIAQFKPRVCGDLAMWDLIGGRQAALFRRYLREALDIVGKDQILFATDGPSFEPLVPAGQWLGIIRGLATASRNSLATESSDGIATESSDGISFSEDEVQAILGGNAREDFRL